MRLTSVMRKMIVTCSMLLAMPVLAQPPVAPDWIADPKSGCKVWNIWQTGIEAKDRMSWSGACKEGLAEGPGVSQFFRDGKPAAYPRYEGKYQGGKQTGTGVVMFDNGARYEGDLKEGDLNGRGIFKMIDGSRYAGDFKNGDMNGTGALLDGNGHLYQGQFKDGELNGEGAAFLKGGNSYEGGFKAGKPDGIGRAAIDGKSYSGPWIEGCFHQGDRKIGFGVTQKECDSK